MYPIVDILCSSPASNTHSKKRDITIQNPMEHLDDDSLDQQYFFALPNTLDDDMVVQLIQCDTTSYDLQELESEDFTTWKVMKAEEVKQWWMKRIREKVGLLKKLKQELRQCHKLSWMENGFPGIWWWHMKYWDEDLGLKVKKEEPLTPTLQNIKVETSPTLNLLYPYRSLSLSQYQSLDPNDFIWGSPLPA